MPLCDRPGLRLCRYLPSFNPCFSGCRSATFGDLTMRIPFFGFNPCFSGCRSATAVWFAMLATPITRVSILVLVDAALRLGASPVPSHGVLSFNPCFSGCRSATLTLVCDLQRRQSFNPCFSGCRSATMVSPTNIADRRGFNPCFSGCRSATISSSPPLATLRCFNPCFSGCRSATIYHYTMKAQILQFQSLF